MHTHIYIYIYNIYIYIYIYIYSLKRLHVALKDISLALLAILAKYQIKFSCLTSYSIQLVSFIWYKFKSKLVQNLSLRFISREMIFSQQIVPLSAWEEKFWWENCLIEFQCNFQTWSGNALTARPLWWYFFILHMSNYNIYWKARIYVWGMSLSNMVFYIFYIRDFCCRVLSEIFNCSFHSFIISFFYDSDLPWALWLIIWLTI